MIVRTLLVLSFIAMMTTKSAAASSDVGVRAQSLGGAFRAVASSNDSIFCNAAGLLKYRRIASDVEYKWNIDNKNHDFTVSIVDSRTTSWGLGLAYSAGLKAQEVKRSSHLFHVALAMPIIGDHLAIGTAFSYLYDPSTRNDPFRHFFNIDLALLGRFPSGLSFAATFDHVLRHKGSEKPLGISLAAAFDLGDVVSEVPLTISFDWTMADVKSQSSLNHLIASGLQYVAFSMVPIRIGFKSELKDKNNFLSLGTGILTESFSVDGLYQQHLTIGKLREFGVAVRMNF